VNISRTWLFVVADLLGLTVLAILVMVVIRWLAPNDGSRLVLGLVAYTFLAVCSLSMWHKDGASKKISKASEWAKLGAGSILVGALFFGIDMLNGKIFHSGVSPLEAGTKAGGLFGFGLTLICCPGMTMVAAAGFARSYLVPRERR
jgi:hypothetical protein